MRSLLLALTIGLMTAFPAHAAGAKPPAAYGDKAQDLVEAYSDAGRFSGAILVAKDGKPIFRKGFGLANREWGVAVTPETVFRLGSVTKQFTAAAILQLAEQGKLGLDDPISKHYPSAPAAWAPITLRHLLVHTSGIPSYTAIPGFFGNPSRNDRTPEEIIALTRDKPLEFVPGTKFAYDNTGYVLLGYVIEKVSGQTYQAYLRDHILAPAGLKASGYDVSEEILPRRAAGYALSGAEIHNAAYLSMTLPHAAGSLYSTVDDLLAWDQALHAGKVLKPASVTAMFTAQGHQYGFGQFIGVENGHRVWNHGGGINGFSTVLARYPDDGLTVVVLSNMTQGPSGKIARELAALHFGEAKPTPTVKLKPAMLDQYVGLYQLGPRLVLRVRRDGDRLSLQPTGQPPTPFYPTSERAFAARIVESVATFDTPVDGRSPGMTTLQGGVELKGKRIETAEADRIESQPKPTLTEVAIDAALLDRYVGSYRVTPALTAVVSREADRLFLQATGQPKVELFASAPNAFFIKVVDVQVTFNGPAGGKAMEMVVRQNGADIAGPRIE